MQKSIKIEDKYGRAKNLKNFIFAKLYIIFIRNINKKS